jgi:hypothetical protein
MSACTDAINTRIASGEAFDRWKRETNSNLDQARDVSGMQAAIFNTSNCLSEKIRNISTLSSSDSQIQLKIESLEKEIGDETKNIEIAKQRLESIRVNEVSHYEGWFPIERPLRPGSAAILLAVSVAISFISLAYVLQLMNVYIFVKYLGTSSVGFNIGPILQQFTILFWITLVTLIGVVLYFVYR